MKYGCHNKPRATHYYCAESHQWIKDEMSKPCQYDRRGADAKCKGCTK